jgi:cytochrome c oxidase subunit IV
VTQHPSAKPESAKKHIFSFALMILFTCAAFYLVMQEVVPGRWLLPILLVLAALQVGLQLFTFMHLDQKGSAYYTIFILMGLWIAVISAIGIIFM